MNQLDYAYSVAYIRAIENKLLTKSDIESLIVSKSPKEVIRMLRDKGYAKEIDNEADYETMLGEEMKKAWQEVKDVAPDGASLDILLYKNDFHNLKAILKCVITGKDNYEDYILSPATVDYKEIVSAVNEQDFSSLPDMLKSVASDAYEVLSTTLDGQLSDIMVDKACMDFMMSDALKSGNEFLINYVKLVNTVSDIKTAVRCARTGKNADFTERALSENSSIDRDALKKAVLSGENAVLEELAVSGFVKEAEHLKVSMADFEKYSDNLISDFMKETKYITLGIEPLIAYINAKRSEIQSVRVILSGKLNVFDENSIRQRLI